jgi:hypothetical protein
MSGRLLSTLLVATLAGLVATVRPPRVTLATSTSMIPDPRVVSVLARSHIALVTDLYWIRMTSLGARVNLPPEGRALIAWGEFVTDLDHQMFWAYVMGGVLGGMRHGKVSYNGAEAAHLLEKGTRYIADSRLYVYLAYAQLRLLDDPAAAAETLRRGSAVPGAPSFMAPLATRLMAQVGQFDRARTFAQAMANSDDPTTRETFRRRLLEIDREEILTRVDEASEEFMRRHGRVAESVAVLVGEGLLAEYPVDPLGGTIELGADGKAVVSSGSRLRAFISEDD